MNDAQTTEALQRLRRVEEARLKLHKIMEVHKIEITSLLGLKLMEVSDNLWQVANQRLTNENEWPRTNWPEYIETN